MSKLGQAGEGFFKMEMILVVLVRQFVKLGFVGFELLDEVHEVARLLKLLQVLSINHVAELILNTNDEFNSIKRIEAVVCESGVKGDAGLLSGSEVVANNRKNVLLNLILA